MNKNILVYTQWPFFDGLTLSYVLPYIKLIKKYIPQNIKIYLVTQEQKPDNLQLVPQQILIKKMNEENIFLIHEKYYNIGIKKYFAAPFNFLKLFLKLYTKNISIIHTQAMSAGMIGCLLSWLSGKKLIVDSYEPLSESMVEGNIWKKESFAFKLVHYFEKKQAQQASYIIACTNEMLYYAKQTYGITLNNFYWKPACVDMELFKYSECDDKQLRRKFGFENKIVAIYVGKFGSQYLEHEVFDFFEVCRNFWGDNFRVLILTSHTNEELKLYCDKSGFPFKLIQKEFVPHSEVKKYLSVANFALTPVKPLPSKRYCTPIKDGEYWAMGLPVVITNNISDDSDIIIKENIGTVITTFTAKSYFKNIIELDNLLQSMPQSNLKLKIRNVAKKYRHFNIAENVYKNIYSNLYELK